MVTKKATGTEWSWNSLGAGVHRGQRMLSAPTLIYRKIVGPVNIIRSVSNSKLKHLRKAQISRRELFLWMLLLFCFLSLLRKDGTFGLPFMNKLTTEKLAPGEPEHRHAMLQDAEVLSHSPDPCADVLQIPRVALLFLTKGLLYHESSWRLWLKSAKGLIPAQVVGEKVCDAGSTGTTASYTRLTQAARVCKDIETGFGDDDYRLQHLFSIYVHAPPKVRDYHKNSLFRGKLVTHRVATQWGAHTLVEATRHLLWEAFRDPLNTRFILLSESDIPLYDPLTFYQQLQSETKSRLDTCVHEGTSPWRWHPKMETPNLKFHHWRKSPQWMMMTRAHVKLALDDREVYRMFERHCWSAWDDKNSRWHRDCFSDEHYFATLLASKGQDSEGVCESRGVSYTTWEHNSAHPKSFNAPDVHEELFHKAREAPATVTGKQKARCDWRRAQSEAGKLFISLDDALNSEKNDDICTSLAANPPFFKASLSDMCFLTARKFGLDTKFAVKKLFLHCDSDVKMLHPEVCLEQGGVMCHSLLGRLKTIFIKDSC